MSGEQQTTTAQVGEPDRPATPPAGEVDGGVNLPLLLGLLAVLALVSVQNVWLRRRAERDEAAKRPPPDDADG